MSLQRLTMLLCVMLLGAAAPREVRLTRIERPGFTIDVPYYFNIDAGPGDVIVLEAFMPPSVDKRGLAWEMAVRVEVAKNANPQRAPVDATLVGLFKAMKERLGANLIGGPVIAPLQIEGADEAKLVVYRTKEHGFICWRYDLYVHADTDIYLATGWLSARAGSEMLDKDHAASDLLRNSMASFRIVRPATPATTQATSKPATQPAPASS